MGYGEIKTTLDKMQQPFSHSELIEKIASLQSTTELEEIAKTLDSKQFIDILFAISHEQIPLTKLDPILVGLNNEAFNGSLATLPDPIIKILVKESASEPLMHQLTLLVHQCQLAHNHFFQETHKLREQLIHLNREEMGYQEVYFAHELIGQIGNYYLNILETINRALEICWNSERGDLIEKLSHLKEFAILQIKNEIGVPGDQEIPPSGVMMLLKNSLEEVYSRSELTDETPAIEGLVNLSVWYLKDYFEMGLLPEISTLEELEAPKGSKEADKIAYKQRLFHAVSENLKLLKLNTVGDLKNAGIYSRRMLKEYIAHHAPKKD